jgi:hypothetical protein
MWLVALRHSSSKGRECPLARIRSKSRRDYGTDAGSKRSAEFVLLQFPCDTGAVKKLQSIKLISRYRIGFLNSRQSLNKAF